MGEIYRKRRRGGALLRLLESTQGRTLAMEKQPPTPSIIINLSHETSGVMNSIFQILLRENPTRKLVTRFLNVYLNADGCIDLASYDPSDTPPLTVQTEHAPESYAKTRAEIFQLASRDISNLCEKLREFTHQIYAHEQLLMAGWLSGTDIPMNFFVIADISEPKAGGMLFPTLTAINRIQPEVPLSSIHLLLNSAVFSTQTDAAKEEELLANTLLLELNELLASGPNFWINLTGSVEPGNNSFRIPTVYLFDKYKEGSYLVKDKEELLLLFGNALLALLQDDLARHLTQNHDEFEILENQSFYNSIGASSLIYDPESLQEYCAKKAAAEYLASVILSNESDPNAVEKEARIILSQLGIPLEWAERLAKPIAAEVGIPIEIENSDLSISVSQGSVKLSLLDYFRLSKTKWGEDLKAIWADFENKLLPQIEKVLAEEAVAWQTESNEFLDQKTRLMVCNNALHSAIIHNSIGVLDYISTHLDHVVAQTASITSHTPEKISGLLARYEKNLEQIERLLADAPALPAWFRFIPHPLRHRSIPLYYTLSYGRQIQILKGLGSEAALLIRQLMGVRIQDIVIQHICDTVSIWQDRLASAHQNCSKTVESFSLLCESIAAALDIFPLGVDANSWHQIFRIPIVDASYAEWAFAKWHPNFDEWMHKLTKSNLLLQWPAVDVNAFSAWLMTQGKASYSPLWQQTMADVIEQRFISNYLGNGKQNDIAALVNLCKHSSLPPIRLDFDAIGGARGAYNSACIVASIHLKNQFWQARDSESLLPWQIYVSGNLLHALFVQFRHCFPLSALKMCRSGGIVKKPSLSPNIREEYRIIKADENNQI